MERHTARITPRTRGLENLRALRGVVATRDYTRKSGQEQTHFHSATVQSELTSAPSSLRSPLQSPGARSVGESAASAGCWTTAAPLPPRGWGWPPASWWRRLLWLAGSPSPASGCRAPRSAALRRSPLAAPLAAPARSPLRSPPAAPPRRSPPRSPSDGSLGHSQQHCNAGLTRGGGGASPADSTRSQK